MRAPRQLPPDYQPFTDEQRRLRRAYGGGDRSDAARNAQLDYNAWKRRFPTVTIPALPPLTDDGTVTPTVVISVEQAIAEIPHGTPAGAAAGCKGTMCAHHGDPDRMTCEQAKIRYAGDWAYRVAINSGIVDTYKPGHGPAEVTLAATPAGPVVTHKPAKPKTAAPAPQPVPEISETSVDLVIDTTAIAAAGEADTSTDATEADPDVTSATPEDETFELQEPPIGDEAPIDEEAIDALAELQKRYDQTRLDLVNAEQALREAKTIHRRDVDAWMHERDHLTDQVIPELERQLRLANTVTATAQTELEETRAQLALERRDHAAYTALAGTPLTPQTHDGHPIEGTWTKAWIFDPSPQPRRVLPQRSEGTASIVRRSRQIRRAR